MHANLQTVYLGHDGSDNLSKALTVFPESLLLGLVIDNLIKNRTRQCRSRTVLQQELPILQLCNHAFAEQYIFVVACRGHHGPHTRKETALCIEQRGLRDIDIQSGLAVLRQTLSNKRFRLQ
jgi:hypothetical protein